MPGRVPGRRMDRVDVAVVGGGPAGTSAAWTAAESGADTLVIEKGVPRNDRDRLGPDSTDAAGMLDYWVDLMDFEPGEIPEDVVLRSQSSKRARWNANPKSG